MAIREDQILNQILPSLCKLLNIDNIKPHLMSMGVLTEGESQSLTTGLNNKKKEVVTNLVVVLTSKGPRCANLLLSALRESVSGRGKYPHSHLQLIGILEDKLRKGGRLLQGSGLRRTDNGSAACLGKPDNRTQPGVAEWLGASDTAAPGGLVPSCNGTGTPPAQQQPGFNLSPAPTRHRKKTSSAAEENLPGFSREPVQLMRYECLYSGGARRKEMESHRVALVRESKAIRRQFTDFVLNVCELLENSPAATVQKIKLSLQYLGNPYTVLPKKVPRHPVFDARSSVTKANTIPGLLSALRECSSWFNYDIVSYLAQRFGGEEGKQLSQLYEAQLKAYFQRLVFHSPPFSSDEQCPLHGFEELTVMVDWDLRVCSIQDIAIFKSALCRLLDIQPCAFVLRSVNEAPAQLTWGIPSGYLPQAVSKAMSNANAFSEEGVQSMKVGSKVIDFPSSRKPKGKHVPQPLKHLNHPSPRHCDLPPASKNVRVLPDKTPTAQLSSIPTSLELNSNSLQARKSPTINGCSPVHAYGIRTDRLSSACETLGEYARPDDMEVLSLVQSPVAVNRAYSQFYFDPEEMSNSITQAQHEPLSGSTPSEELILPTPDLELLSECEATGADSAQQTQPQGVTGYTHSSSTTSPSASAPLSPPQLPDEEQSSPSPLQPLQYQLSIPSSLERLEASPIANPAIKVAAFEGVSTCVGSPMSASVISIGTKREEESDTGKDREPENIPESRRQDGVSSQAGNVNMDMMLSAACEARRKRGRRNRIDLETARRLTQIVPAHVQAALPREGNTTSAEVVGEVRHLPILERASEERELVPVASEADTTTWSPTPRPDDQELPNRVKSPSRNRTPTQEVGHPLHSTPRHDRDLSTSNPPNESTISLQSAHSHSTVHSLHSSPEPLGTPIYTPGDKSPVPILSPLIMALESKPSPSEHGRKAVGFLWRLLGRASKQYPASLYVAAIATTHSWQKDELPVRKGQQFKAMFRVANRIFVVNHQNVQGYIPYQYCRISKKYYSPSSRMVQLSYSQLYIQSPDGVDTGSYRPTHSTAPAIEMVAIQEQETENFGDLCVKSGERVRVLYCDETWAYALTDSLKAGFLPRACCRLTRKSQKLFHNWICNNVPFQADFVVKFNEMPPLVLRQNSQLANDLTSPKQDAAVEKHGSKVGKIMTVIRSFQPSGSGSQITITRGLRVRVVKVSGELGLVTTRSGNTFWIPFSFLRPAIKASGEFDSQPVEISQTDPFIVHGRIQAGLERTVSQPVPTSSRESAFQPRPNSFHREAPQSNVFTSSHTARVATLLISSSQPALPTRTMLPSSNFNPGSSIVYRTHPSKLKVIPSYPSDETLGYV